MKRRTLTLTLGGGLLAAALSSVGCVGNSEADAWAEENPREPAPVNWEGEENEKRERRVSARGNDPRSVGDLDARGPGNPGFARTGQRVSVVEGKGWRVTTRGGRPVDTFASAEGPAGFEPADPRQPPAKRVVADDRPGPWLVVPSRRPALDPEQDAPERTPLRLKAEGVNLVPGECGPIPVARYGLDWRPAREWRIGQDEDAEPWLKPIAPLPLPPLPPAPEPVEEGEVLEAEAPAGSWSEAR